MPRHIVLCLDGTNNKLSDSPTNVLRIAQAVEHDDERQLLYYDAGIGIRSGPGSEWDTEWRCSFAAELAVW